MFNLLKTENLSHLFEVKNRPEIVDDILFLRIRSIEVYCYR